MTELAVVMAIHGRHEIVRAALAHFAEIRRIAPVMLVAAISQGDLVLRRELKAAGARWRAVRNFPVADKWQAAASLVRTVCPRATGLMLLGSDDLISPAYYAYCLERLRANADDACGWGPDRCWFYNQPTGEMAEWVVGPAQMQDGYLLPVGAGRVFSRRLLDDVGWKLWHRRINRGLDRDQSKWLLANGYPLTVVDMTTIPGAMVLDIKGARNMNKWDRIPGLSPYSAEDGRDILALHGLPENLFPYAPATP